ncbi:MAG: division/cell wall cluster transcriptional repressor MraZ [Verrucomicrobiae bacterium]|nr:division/cell wall cluster transcriptional repressor MraZ [Verrucomicrobiae bacterium]
MRASYTDQFEHTLDEKRRLTIPAEWRDDGYEQQLFVIPSQEGCLKVYPNSWMGALQEKIAHLPIGDPGRKKVERVAGIAQKLVWDAQGRVRVKDELLSRVGVDRTVRLVGALDHFEIWEPGLRAAAAPAGATLEEMDI